MPVQQGESDVQKRSRDMIRVGFSEVNITPPLGLRMSGMLQPPRAEGVEWPLYARTVVFNDGIDQIAIVSLDLLFLSAPTVAEFREAITAGAGLAPPGAMMACSPPTPGPPPTKPRAWGAQYRT